MKQTIYAFVCCLLVSIFATSCEKDEEVMTGTIIGIVSDYTNANAAIAGATVTINSKGLTKTTGSDGRFEFPDLEPGTYSIQVSANTYQTTTKQVTVYAGQTVNCDFQLEKSGANVEISPITLSFGQGVEQLSFTIRNNSNQAFTYSISNTPDYIEVSPTSGTVAAKSNQAVSVHVKDRSSITSNRSGQLTVNVGNDSYIVSINISNSVNTDPGQGGSDNQGGNSGNGGNGSGNENGGSIAVTRGLLAYYTFDDGKTATNVADPTLYNGQLNGSPEFVTGNNGSGYSVRFKKGQYITIPQNMLDGKRAYSISMWVKDFGQGYLYQTLKGTDILAPTFFINSNDKFQMLYGNSNWYLATFSTEMTKYQEGGWHSITIVKNASNILLLYIDGINVDTQTCGDNTSQGTSVTIGADDTDPMYIDNVRIHGIALSSDEITTIYNAEK